MPVTTRSSHSELPDWLRNYAQEAAIAARNLGVNVTAPPPGSPQGTMPTVGINPYPRYTGRRFADINPAEQQAEQISLQANPLIAALEKAKRTSTMAGQGILDPFEVTSSNGQRVQYTNLFPYSDAYRNLVTGRVSEGTSAPGINRALEESFTGPFSRSRHMRSGLNEANTGHAEDIRNLLAESEDRGRTLNAQAFNQDQARLLEASIGEAERGNLLNLARQNDIANLYQVGGYRRTLDERPLQTAEEEFIREQRHPYEALRFLIGALNGAPVETSIHESINRPEAPRPARSLHASDYMGIAAQAAPNLIGAAMQARQEREANRPALSAEDIARLRQQLMPRIISGEAAPSEIANYTREEQLHRQEQARQEQQRVAQVERDAAIQAELGRVRELRAQADLASRISQQGPQAGTARGYHQRMAQVAWARNPETITGINRQIEDIALRLRQAGYNGPLE